MDFVRIPGRDYCLGRYVVTQSEWFAVMGTAPWRGRKLAQEGPDCPAVFVSWNDCQDLVANLNAREGRNLYRLPTEDQWVHACLAGRTTKYHFGDDASLLGDYAWYQQNAYAVGAKHAHPVGLKQPNDWGLFDMHGNVWEWTATVVDDLRRVSRGGAFNTPAARCLYRYRFKASGRYCSLGVRLLRTC